MKSLAILSFTLLSVVPLAAAQTTTSAVLNPPPIKMGLWKTTNTATIAGIQLPPQVAERLKAMGKSVGEPQTFTTLSCITPDKWKQMFDRQQNQDCTYSNVQQSSSHMSADITCTSSSGRTESTGHMDMTFDSNEKMHGKFHMNVTTQSQAQPMTVDSTLEGAYQGSDCQGISPDSPKVTH